MMRPTLALPALFSSLISMKSFGKKYLPRSFSPLLISHFSSILSNIMVLELRTNVVHSGTQPWHHRLAPLRALLVCKLFRYMSHTNIHCFLVLLFIVDYLTSKIVFDETLASRWQLLNARSTVTIVTSLARGSNLWQYPLPPLFIPASPPLLVLF